MNQPNNNELTMERIASYKGDPNFMASFARGLAVISAFSQQKRRQTIADLARITRLSRASVMRCLHTLLQFGYVEYDGHSYQLTPKVLTLGYAYLTSSRLATTAQPFLDQLTRSLNESCSLAILSKNEIIYVARSSEHRVMSISLSVGSRLPAYCTSMGRVLLADLSLKEQKAYFAQYPLLPLTKYTICDLEHMLQILKQVAKAGFAIVNQELETGLRSIAVPVYNQQQKLVAAMNISSSPSRMSIEGLQRKILPELREAALNLGEFLL